MKNKLQCLRIYHKRLLSFIRINKKSPELFGGSGDFVYLCTQLVELHATRREGNYRWQWDSEPVRMPETYNGKKGVYDALVFIH